MLQRYSVAHKQPTDQFGCRSNQDFTLVVFFDLLLLKQVEEDNQCTHRCGLSYDRLRDQNAFVDLCCIKAVQSKTRQTTTSSPFCTTAELNIACAGHIRQEKLTFFT